MRTRRGMHLYSRRFRRYGSGSNQTCVLNKLDTFQIIGKGKSGYVHLTKWKNISGLFSGDELYNSSYLLDPERDSVTIKTIIPFNEIRQRIGSREQRTLTNLIPYFKDFGNRCTDIYKYMDDASYFGITQHLTKVYGCTYCKNIETPNSDNYLPTMLVSQQYISGLDMSDYFKGLGVSNITMNVVSSILLQGLSIILILFQHNFYHNDMNTGNIIIHNTDNNIDLTYPLFNRHLVLKSHHHTIPFINLIDFDLASIDTPRDDTYRLSDITKLPIIDITTFILSTYTTIIKTCGAKINKNIDKLLSQLVKILDTYFIQYTLDPSTFSRAKLIFNNEIDIDRQVLYLKQIFDKLIINNDTKVDGVE